MKKLLARLPKFTKHSKFYLLFAFMTPALLMLVKNNNAVFNNVNSRRVQTAVNSVGEIFHQRLMSEELAPEVTEAIRVALVQFPDTQATEAITFKLAGNTKLFYEVMLAAWAAFCSSMILSSLSL